MGLFTDFFKKIRARMWTSRPVTSQTASARWNKEAYEQETVRAIVDAISTAAAMGKARHVVLDSEGRVKDVKHNSVYAKLLNQQPNWLMSGYDLKYKLITQLETKSTALCYVDWAVDGRRVVPRAFIPIVYNKFQVREIVGGGYAIEFDDWEGNHRYVNVEDTVILRKFYNGLDVAGDSNEPINNTLSMIKSSDDGYMEALTVSNKVRGLLSIKRAMLDPKDVQANQEDFARRFEAAARSGGIIATDPTESYTPLNVTAYSANAAQMRLVRENLFIYYRTGEEIVKNSASPESRKAWMDSVVNPIWEMMGQAFTNACFTQRERDMGNRIVFSGDLLSTSSDSTKIQLIQAVREIGILSANEIREMFGMSPIEGGDIRQVSLNYINSINQGEYQVGDNDKTEEVGDDGKTREPDETV
jgi:hypothetical protein